MSGGPAPEPDATWADERLARKMGKLIDPGVLDRAAKTAEVGDRVARAFQPQLDRLARQVGQPFRAMQQRELNVLKGAMPAIAALHTQQAGVAATLKAIEGVRPFDGPMPRMVDHAARTAASAADTASAVTDLVAVAETTELLGQLAAVAQETRSRQDAAARTQTRRFRVAMALAVLTLIAAIASVVATVMTS